MLQEYLEARGLEAITSPDGWSCLWDIVAAKPDAIVMDIEMPRIDGLTAMDMMRATKLTEQTPILVSSALGDKETILKASQLGADDFIVKPYRFEDIAQRIENLVLQVDELTLTELLNAIENKPRPIEEWPELHSAGYRGWSAFPVLFRGRELCVLIKGGVSRNQAKHMSIEESKENVVILAKFSNHWKSIFPIRPMNASVLEKLIKPAA